MNGEVFEIAQKLLNSALCIRHSALNPAKIKNQAMTSQLDFKRNILLRTTIQADSEAHVACELTSPLTTKGVVIWHPWTPCSYGILDFCDVRAYSLGCWR